MILDMNVYLGRWPFAPLGYETADDLLRLMDRAGVERAAISSLNSVFYYDAEIGNREVGAAAKAHPDRFIPFAVVNPNLLGWRDHLLECVERFGIRGIKLHADYHKFSLVPDNSIGDEIAKLMAETRERKLVTFVQTSLFDLRHHPAYCYVPEVPISDVVQALTQYRDNYFVVGGGLWFRARALDLVNQARHAGLANFSIATDGIGGYYDGLGYIVREIGGERLVFSSRTPILYTEAARDVVQTSELDEAEKAAILGGNAARLLGLD